MRLYSYILAIILFHSILFLGSCNNKNLDDEPKEENDNYQYDNDLDYDSASFLGSYIGETYRGPHLVPGTIEGEDFDIGVNGIAFNESDTKSADSNYRGASMVDLRSDSKASNNYYVGEIQPGEWMNYTIEVENDGTYDVDIYIVKGDGSRGSFLLELDGLIISRSIEMPLGEWSDFTQKVKADDIQLTKGRHILKYYAESPGNLDKFVFNRTGDMQNISGFTYPVTKRMKNPLFTEFDSPMYKSRIKGPLYTADASAHVWNINGKEVLYVYASHDMEPAIGCDRMDRYHVFSTEDMENWTDHGEIMNAATARLHVGWGSDGFMWAPDCAYNPNDKLYYLYFPHPESTEKWNSTWRICVATSKHPDKEFTVKGYIKNMPAYIDPCIFVDDGQPYIYNGGGGLCFGAKLSKDDWTKLDGTPVSMLGLKDFHEATWVHKRDGMYYLSYADNYSNNFGGANRLRYAVSNNPLGPWTYKDVYVGSTTSDTNHGSIVEFKGQWYAFYHCSDISHKGNLRSVCVDKLFYNNDGTIQMVKQTR